MPASVGSDVSGFRDAMAIPIKMCCERGVRRSIDKILQCNLSSQSRHSTRHCEYIQSCHTGEHTSRAHVQPLHVTA